MVATGLKSNQKKRTAVFCVMPTSGFCIWVYFRPAIYHIMELGGADKTYGTQI